LIRRRRTWVLISMLAWMLGACADQLTPSPQSEIRPSESASSLSPSATAVTVTDYDVQLAATFRRKVGLRSDEPWIRLVAADPASEDGRRHFGVPLTPEETTQLLNRAANNDELTTTVQLYGADHQDVYGGMYVETATEHVIAMFVGPLEAHRTALDALVSPDAPLELRSVTWPLRQLRTLGDRVAHDPWLPDHGYHVLTAGADIKRNLVILEVSSAELKAAALIAAHFDAGAMLEISTDGTGIANQATGILMGVVIDPTGQPVVGYDVDLVTDLPGAGNQGNGTETDQDGRFEMRHVAPSTYVIRILRNRDANGVALEGGNRIEVGRTFAQVRSGEVTFVTIPTYRG
jgi:Carboxypeptidase regulatory-like domain